MCLSPEADLVAGVVVGAIATSAWVSRPAARDVPLVLVPTVLAAHSLIEAFVWWGERGQVGDGVRSVATWVYVFVAFVLVPTLVPFAIWFRETSRRHRQVLGALLAVGVVVSIVMLEAMLDGPVNATIRGHYISYAVGIPARDLVIAGYVLAACGAGLASSTRAIRVFGLANLVVVAVLVWVSAHALTSLWCLWAAVTSIAIAQLVRRDREPRLVH